MKDVVTVLVVLVVLVALPLGVEASMLSMSPASSSLEFDILYGSQNEDTRSPSAWLTIGTPYHIDGGNWSISFENQSWYATYDFSGFEVEETMPESFDSLWLNQSGLTIYQYDGMHSYSTWPDRKIWNHLHGGLFIQPGEVLSVNFSFGKYPDLDNLYLTRFSGQFNVEGRIVPEPATVCLLSVGTAILFAGFRRRKR